MHARVVLGVGKGALFREVSSLYEYPQRERFHSGNYMQYIILNCWTKEKDCGCFW